MEIFTVIRKATRGRETLKLRSREVGAFFEGRNLQKAVVTTVLGNIIHTHIMNIYTCTRTYNSVIAITVNTYYILPLAVYGLIEEI